MTKTKTILGVSFAAVFVFAMMANPVFANGGPVEVSATASEGTITITSSADIGTIEPKSPNLITGFVAITDVGAFIVASHFGVDDDDATDDHEWHSHSFTLDDNGCVATIDGAGTASVSGNTITVEGTGATSVSNAFLALLKINNDGSICVLKGF